jgi:hypothetical protein
MSELIPLAHESRANAERAIDKRWPEAMKAE